MEQCKVVFDAYCGYDAVNGFPYSLAIFSALSVDFCRLKIGFNTLRFINWKLEKIILHPLEIFIRVTSYREIPTQDSDRAIQWLQAQIAMAKPKIRRKALDKWKESLYKPICARAGELGISKDDLYLLAQEQLATKKPIRSLKELTQRDLQWLHHVMIYEVKKSGSKP